MGLASKLAAAQAAQNNAGAPPAGAPPAGAPPAGAPPAGAPPATGAPQNQQQYGIPQTQPLQFGAPQGQQGQQGQQRASGQQGYGAAPSQQSPYPPTQYGNNQLPSQQQPGGQKYGSAPGAYGQQQQQAPAPAYNNKPPQQQQYGQQGSGNYGQQSQQYGQAPSQQQRPPQQQQQYGQQQYGQQQYGQQPQYGQQQGSGNYGQAPQQQQQQYGAPGGAPGGANRYLSSLQNAVRENNIQAFYSPDQLARISSTIEPKIIDACKQWRIPREIGDDLARLALYDIVIYADDSGSMSFEENGERIDDLKLILSRAAFVASLFDEDGIQVRFMNNSVQGNGLRTEQQVMDLVSQVQFRGLTPLGTNLQSKVLEPLVVNPARSGALRKPVLLLTITDGSPAGEPEKAIFEVIARTKQVLGSTRYGAGAVAFQFAQVGNDLKARDFLSKLDSDPVVGRMVDCTSNFEVEQDEMAKLGVNLDPSTWLVKLLLGAIDPSYDTQDESK